MDERKITLDNLYDYIGKNWGREDEILVKCYLSHRLAEGLKICSVFGNLKKIKKFSDFVRKPLKLIGREDTERFLAFMETNGYAYDTKLVTRLYIRKFLEWLGRDVSWITIPRNRQKKLPKKIFSNDEVVTMIRRGNNIKQKLLISLGYECALRTGELLNLTKDSFFEDGGVWYVRVYGKTGERILPIRESVPLLKEFLKKYERFNYNITRPSIIVKNKSRDQNVSFYTLRHSRLTDLARKGMSDSMMKVFAGWSMSSKMPAIYVHLSSIDLKDFFICAWDKN